MKTDELLEFIAKEKEKLVRNFHFAAETNMSGTEYILNTLAHLAAMVQVLESRLTRLEQTWHKALDS